MKKFLSFIFFSLFSAQSQAGDVEAGKMKAAICGSCHGQNGISFSPDFPNLAGQKAGYLEKAINYYRSGERKNAMMNSIAVSLSDDDIKNLAAYYSSLKP